MIVVAINFLLVYVSVTSVTIVNEKNIIKYSWYNPKGIEYEYEEVVQVDTGFRGNVLGLPGQKRGDFYYNITFNNGKEIKFWSSNTEKYDFIYTEYKVIDDIIMKNKVKK